LKKKSEFYKKWKKKIAELTEYYGEYIPIKYLVEMKLDAINAILKKQAELEKKSKC